MTVTFLGTGTSQGVPVIGCRCAVCRSVDYRDQRLRVAVHVAVAGQSLLIDAGPDFRQQMLRANIGRLDAILLTHEHKDHTAGLDDIRAYNFAQNRAMPLWAETRVLAQVRQEFAYIFAAHKYPGTPSIDQHEIVPGHAFSPLPGLTVEPVRVFHHKLPVLGFRIGTFAYVTDANAIAPEELAKLRGCDTIVLNALRHEPHLSHFSLREAVAVLEDLAPRRAYLTHISHLLGLHREVEPTLPPFIRLAFDGLALTLPDPA
ncbi:MAG: MBL fold metallo-hydrolase [Hymenobacteraceae bacterium]|nr:MBL fold metallo-hydrolase [Hymenobacteraceae bacterium]